MVLIETPDLVYNLRLPALAELELAGAIREVAAQYGVHRSAKNPENAQGLRIDRDAPEWLPHLPATVEVATYRIAQEALPNVVRHAGAGTCLVRISLDGVLELEITDVGIGLPPDRPAGVGLTSMRERAVELGETCEILPTPPVAPAC